jgi:hypothetical protein
MSPSGFDQNHSLPVIERIQLRMLAWFSGIALVSMALLALSHNAIDQDLWHEMALAREILRIGHVPVADTFAYTPTVRPVVQHEWGAGLIAWMTAKYLGGGGIIGLKFVLGAGLAWFGAIGLRRAKPSQSLMAICLPVAIVLIQPALGTVRAQLYSLLFFSILLWMLSLDRDGRRTWISPWLVIFVVWLNIHGGFVVAFGIIAAEWLERLLRGKEGKHLLFVLFSMAALIAVNPYGFGYYRYISQAVTMSRPHIVEWKPIWVLWPAAPLLLSVFAFSIVLFGYGIKCQSVKAAQGILMLLFTLLMAFRTNRMVCFYGIAWLFVVPGLIGGTGLDVRIKRFWIRAAPLNLVLSAVFAAIFMTLFVSRKPWIPIVPAGSLAQFGDTIVYPVWAVEYLKRHEFKGNIMTSFVWGAYVSWNLYPAAKISMDSRYETAYPAWLTEEMIELYRSAKNWEQVFNSYPTDLVMVEKRSCLCKKIQNIAPWHTVYTDDQFCIMGKDGVDLPIEDRSGRRSDGTFP